MLEGFRLSSTPLIQKKDFPPPQLPRKFKPVHVFRKPEEEENQSTVGPPGSARGKTQFTDAMSRGVALGEQPFVGMTALDNFFLHPRLELFLPAIHNECCLLDHLLMCFGSSY